MTGTTEYRFRCSSCGEEIHVNASMREVLLDQGCAVCGTETGAANFETAE